MRGLDFVALAAVVVCGLTVFARAEILGPRVKSAYQTNFLVRRMMDLTAFACVPVGFEIVGGAHLSPGVVAFLAICAVTSSQMLVSMVVHDGRELVISRSIETRAEDVAEVRAAVEETVPAAIDAAIPQVLKDLSARPDPYDFQQPEREA